MTSVCYLFTVFILSLTGAATCHAGQARQLSERAKIPALQVAAILQLSFAYRSVRQENKAGELLKNGAEAVQQISDPRRRQFLEAAVLRELGQHYLNKAETQKAIDYIAASLKIQESRLAALQASGGRGAGAARSRALANAEKTIMTGYLRLGSAQREAGRFADAAKSFERGFELMQRMGQKLGSEGKFLLEFGELYLAQNDYSRAMEFFDRVLRDSKIALGEPLAMRAASQMGYSLLDTGKPLEAISQFKRAIDNIETIRAALDSEDLRTSFFENKRKVYAGMVLAQLAAGRVDEAFNFNERARSRAFLDILGNKVLLSRDRKLIEEEQALRTRMRELEAKLTPAGEDDERDDEPSEAEDVTKNLAEAQQAYESLLAKVRQENREQASLMNVEPLTVKQVQESLSPGVTLVEYFVAGDQILLWVIDRSQVNVVKISQRRRDLLVRLRSLRQSISEPPNQSQLLTNGLRELFDRLIEPALPYIKGQELLIISHDVLHYVPFQGLVSKQGRYLIQDYSIRYLSSASLMRFTNEKRRPNRQTALALGNPSLGDDAYNLRFAEREAREIAQLFPKAAALLKEQATKAKTVSLAPNHDVLHFAAHAEYKENDPMSSALLLAREGAEDGRLKASEVFALNLKADLVVLSACESGLGKISNGDEIIGLTRAFIYAGTPSVITTLWKVDDRASDELMREFYGNLKSMTKSEALRQAQLTTMKQFPHPYYWAAYVLTGEP